MRVVSLIGRAGSGKSTIGKILAKKLGFHYISTGDLARTLQDLTWAEEGALAPEEAIRKLLIQEVGKCGMEGIVLDGMPRIPDQVLFLHEHFEGLIFIEIMVDQATSMLRLYNRNRNDDNEDAINKRLEVFDNNIYGIMSAIADIGAMCKVYSNDDDINMRDLISTIINDIDNKEE